MGHRTDPKDIAALLQIAVGVAEREDDAQRAADWVIERLCQLTGASAGVIALAGEGGRLRVHNGARRPDPADAPAPAAMRAAGPRRAGVVRPTARLLPGALCSALPLPDGSTSVIWLSQPRPARRAWGAREVALLELLHPEVLPLHRTLPERDDDAGLPPRQRQTLRLLLRGLSEKQIAAELDLSVHTVHVYVKAIYRAHHVTSRAELLAKWVKA